MARPRGRKRIANPSPGCYTFRTMNTTPISSAKQAADAADFAAFWQGKGYEKGQPQPFWLHLLRVLGVESPESFMKAKHIGRGREKGWSALCVLLGEEGGAPWATA